MRRIFSILAVVVLLLMNWTSCSTDKPTPDFHSYPEEVAAIIPTKCATSGCHREANRAAAGGLSMQNWNQLFEGSRGGSPVIPFRSDLSWLLHSINPDASAGPTLLPAMPYKLPPLSAAEQEVLKDWIDDGAPNFEGDIKFQEYTTRRKLYAANEGCDLVAVFDAETSVLMRYVDVGTLEGIEGPHMVKVSPDGAYWYVVFSGKALMQKFRTSDDAFVAQVDYGAGNWSAFTISKDGQRAYVTDLFRHDLLVIDLQNMSIAEVPFIPFVLPHGVALDKNEEYLYLTGQVGNILYKIKLSDYSRKLVSLNPPSPPSITSSLNPHEILFSPNYSKYYVACQESDDVRVFTSANDSLIAIVKTGAFPQEMVIDPIRGYLFVSCMQDNTNFPGKTGSIAVIDTENDALIRLIHTGAEPSSMVIEPEKQLLYVCNRNADDSGPTPHHASKCTGRNGYVTLVDLNSLTPVPNYKVEVSVNPASITYRH